MKTYNTQLITEYLKNGLKTKDIFEEFTPKSVLLQPILSNFVNEIKCKAESLCNTFIPELPYSLFSLFDKTGNRIKYEKVYFERRSRLAVFALMAWLYGNDEYVAELEDILWAVCGEYTWALPAHMYGNSINESADENTVDLFACETAQTLSEILHILRERLSVAVIMRCKKEIKKRVLNPFIESKNAFNWEELKNNWCAVCGGSIGMTAIYIIESDEELARYVYRLFRSMQNFLDGFESDGVCLEGLGYWTYGFGYFTAYADMLFKRTSGKINLFEYDKVKLVAGFQSALYLTGGRTVSFADGESSGKFRAGLTSYLIKRFNVIPPPVSSAAGFNYDYCYRFCMLFRDLIWTSDVLYNNDCEAKNIDFPVSQWHIWNTGTIGVAVKGGHNSEPHNHNDIGNFQVYYKGGDLLTDLGAGEYTKEYFGSNRYKIFCNSSYGHSVPVINGECQIEGKGFGASAYNYASPDKVVIDIENAYNIESLKKLRREISFMNEELEIHDCYEFESMPESVEERFITRQQPELYNEFVLLRTEFGDSAKLNFCPNTYKINIEKHTHAEHNGTNTDVYSISFKIINLSKKMNVHFGIQFN